MLENLVIAVESEAQIVDIGRVSGFMQKVRGLLSTSILRPDHLVSRSAMVSSDLICLMSLIFLFANPIVLCFTSLY
jgi:hypothetical protein